MADQEIRHLKNRNAKKVLIGVSTGLQRNSLVKDAAGDLISTVNTFYPFQLFYVVVNKDGRQVHVIAKGIPGGCIITVPAAILKIQATKRYETNRHQDNSPN